MSNYSKITTLLLGVTCRCNAFCDYCSSRYLTTQKDEISLEILKKILDDTALNFGTESIILNIVGGEPLMRRDFFEITKYADNLGFKWGLLTNGILITDEIISKMEETHMSTITISLDGLEEIHEKSRHINDCFDSIITSIKKLKARNFIETIQIAFTANKFNIHELPEIYELACMLKVDSLSIGGINPIDLANNKSLMLSGEDYQFLFNFIQKHSKSKIPVKSNYTYCYCNENIKSAIYSLY